MRLVSLLTAVALCAIAPTATTAQQTGCSLHRVEVSRIYGNDQKVTVENIVAEYCDKRMPLENVARATVGAGNVAHDLLAVLTAIGDAIERDARFRTFRENAELYRRGAHFASDPACPITRTPSSACAPRMATSFGDVKHAASQ